MARQLNGMRAVGPALVRTPSRPYAAGSPSVSLPRTLEDASKETLRAVIEAYAGDDAFMEAVALANPMVARQALTQIEQLPLKRLRRLALTLKAYDSRSRARATPYGLFAAVGLEGQPEGKSAYAGGSSAVDTRRFAQVSMGWLAPVLDRIETSAPGLSALAYVANPGIRKDDAHLVVDRPRPGVRQARLRATSDVTDVLAACTSPRTGDQLVAALGTFDREPEQVRATQLALVKHGFLRSTLGADPHAVTPSSLAAGLNKAGILPSVTQALLDLSTAVDLHNDGGQARRVEALEAAERAGAVVARTLDLTLGDESLLHVDLLLAAAPSLGEGVRREVEQVAALLCRLSPPRRAAAVCEELQRLGGGFAVPLADVTPPQVEPASASPALVDAIDRCRVTGSAELVLDADLIERIAPAENSSEDPTGHLIDLDLAVVVAGPSESRIHSGDFTIHVRRPAATGAGLTAARFATGLGERGLSSARSRVEARDARQPDALHIDVTFRPAEPAAWNTSRTPLHRGSRVTTNDRVDGATHSTGPAPAMAPRGGTSAVERVALDDLVAFPSATGPVVWDLRREQHVVPHSVSTVDPRSGPVVAQVLELLTGDNAALAFPWGELADREWLPRVRFGRCVLSAQQWRLPTILTGEHTGEASWEELLRSWATTHNVPSQVVLTQGDRQLELDLDSALDVAALRREAASSGQVRLLEPLPDDVSWLPGRDGHHLVEAVYSLVPTDSRPSPVGRPEVLPGPGPVSATSPAAATLAATPVPGVTTITLCAPDAAHADLSSLLGSVLAHDLRGARWSLTRTTHRLTVTLSTPEPGDTTRLVERLTQATHHSVPIVMERRPLDAGWSHAVPDPELASEWAQSDSREKSGAGAVSLPEAVSDLAAFGLRLREATGVDPFAAAPRDRIGFSDLRTEVMAGLESEETGLEPSPEHSWSIATDYVLRADTVPARKVRAAMLLRHSALRHLAPVAALDLMPLAASAADAFDAKRRATRTMWEESA